MESPAEGAIEVSARRRRFMKAKALPETFVGQIKEQLKFLCDDDYDYSALHVYIAGVPEAWEFGPGDEFDFHEDSGFLIVRRAPTDDIAEVPETVFRLGNIVATQLV
jgi:hypothetical protein